MVYLHDARQTCSQIADVAWNATIWRVLPRKLWVDSQSNGSKTLVWRLVGTKSFLGGAP